MERHRRLLRRPLQVTRRERGKFFRKARVMLELALAVGWFEVAQRGQLLRQGKVPARTARNLCERGMQAGNNAALVDTYYFLEEPGHKTQHNLHLISSGCCTRLQLRAYRIMTPWRDSFRSCRKAGTLPCVCMSMRSLLQSFSMLMWEQAAFPLDPAKAREIDKCMVLGRMTSSGFLHCVSKKADQKQR